MFKKPGFVGKHPRQLRSRKTILQDNWLFFPKTYEEVPMVGKINVLED